MHRIEVGFKKNVKDVAGEKLARQILDELKIKVNEVRIVDVYTLDFDLSKANLQFLGENLFTDPLVQGFSINKPLGENASSFLRL